MPTSSQDGTTLKSHKRSCTSEEAVTTEEAAKLLSVTEMSIRNYVSKGILRRLGEGNKILVSLQDVQTAASTLSRCFDFVATARIALRALVSAARAERRLERVELLLGIDSFVLGTEEADVIALHEAGVNLLTDFTEDMDPSAVLDWAYKLANVTEEYLDLVNLYTGETEPWVLFMEVAQKLADCAPRDRFKQRKDLEVAYAYVSSARRHLRQVAYFYIRHKYGAATANDAMPDVTTGDRDNKIIELIFSTTQKLQ